MGQKEMLENYASYLSANVPLCVRLGDISLLGHEFVYTVRIQCLAAASSCSHLLAFPIFQTSFSTFKQISLVIQYAQTAEEKKNESS